MKGLLFVGKTYLQINEKYYDDCYKVVIDKELDESGQIDFTKGFEYFNINYGNPGSHL